jgi:diacylglycerol kinase family enzyme
MYLRQKAFCYDRRMSHFDTITAIYNPNSTNDAATKAQDFARAAAERGVEVELFETDHPGHAAEIVQDIIAAHDAPLLVSVSGDGGYNELINGVMRATKNTRKSPVVAILAAGNANDHKRTTRGDTPLLELIVRAAPLPLDLLRLQTEQLDRYAHSYIGLGITSTVGIQLNKHDLNRFNEIGLVIHSLASFAPFRIKRDGIVTAYSNLLFANVDSMSKVIKLDTADNSVHDGKFEVISDVWRGKLRLLLHLLRLVLFGHAHTPQYSQYEFTTVENTAVQMDEEIETLSSGVLVSITAQKAAILSLY